MNKKKTTTQDMSEFGSIEGFDDIMGATPDSSNRGIGELHGEKKTEKASSKRAVKVQLQVVRLDIHAIRICCLKDDRAN